MQRPTQLLDLDGTLTYSRNDQISIDGTRQTLAHFGVVRDGEVVAEMLRQKPLIPILQSQLKPEEIPDAIDFFCRIANNDMNHLKIEPELPGILAQLRDQVVLVVVTGRPRKSAIRNLKAVSLMHYMDLIVAGEDTPESKPHPAPLLHAMREVDASPERTGYIGDSEYDIEAGHAAGVQTDIVLTGSIDEMRVPMLFRKWRLPRKLGIFSNIVSFLRIRYASILQNQDDSVAHMASDDSNQATMWSGD